MELPDDLIIEFDDQIAQYQEEKRMPFIDTFAPEKGPSLVSSSSDR